MYSFYDLFNTSFPINFDINLIVYFLWSLTVIECIYYKPLSTKLGNWIVVCTTTLIPLVVFNGIHYFGLYLFRLRGYSNGKYYETLNVFNDDCSRGKMQIWYPRNFQSASYAVTDLCIAYINNLDERIKWRTPQIIDLCYVGRSELKNKGMLCDKIFLDVKVLNPSKTFTKKTEGWLQKSWSNIGYASFDNNNANWKQEGEIPKYKYTTRWPVQNKITSASDYRKKTKRIDARRFDFILQYLESLSKKDKDHLNNYRLNYRHYNHNDKMINRLQK